MGEMVGFPSNGTACRGYLAEPRPEGAETHPGVLVIQEWWGLNEHVKDVADRFAAEGFFALAPDLYHGTVTRSPDEAGKLLMALDIAQAEKDLRGAVHHLRALTARPIGSVGFCMGGALSLFAACTNPEDIAAAVVYYGGHPRVDFDFDRLKAPVLAHWAQDDDFANPNDSRIAAEMASRGKSYEAHRYPGTRHAFFNDTRPEVYDQGAASLSFRRTVDFLRRRLASPA